MGLRTAREGFADRAYRADGTLVPRHEPGAVIEDTDNRCEPGGLDGEDRALTAVDGSPLALEIETICVHGDTPGAAMLASSRIRQALTDAGVSIPVGVN